MPSTPLLSGPQLAGSHLSLSPLLTPVPHSMACGLSYPHPCVLLSSAISSVSKALLQTLIMIACVSSFKPQVSLLESPSCTTHPNGNPHNHAHPLTPLLLKFYYFFVTLLS